MQQGTDKPPTHLSSLGQDINDETRQAGPRAALKQCVIVLCHVKSFTVGNHPSSSSNRKKKKLLGPPAWTIRTV